MAVDEASSINKLSLAEFPMLLGGSQAVKRGRAGAAALTAGSFDLAQNMCKEIGFGP